MNYQLFTCVIILFILTSHLYVTIGSSVHQHDKKVSIDLDSDLDLDFKPVKWNRRSSQMKKDKGRSRVLTYDFLLHKWFIRKIRN
ncbi:hypothetical protein I4U23_024624 [Adineta vaga]|nr:hypothetical protein I4U23_024624 [Adineta vaga]